MFDVFVSEHLYRGERYANISLSRYGEQDHHRVLVDRADIVDWHVFEACQFNDFLETLRSLSGVPYVDCTRHNCGIPGVVLSPALIKNLVEEEIGRPLDPKDGDGSACLIRAGTQFDTEVHIVRGIQVRNEYRGGFDEFYRTFVISMTEEEIKQKKRELENQTRSARKYALRRIESILKEPLNITGRNYCVHYIDDTADEFFAICDNYKKYVTPPTTIGNAMRIAMAPDGVAIPRLSPEHVAQVQKFIRNYMSDKNVKRDSDLYALWRKYAT